MAKKLRNRGWNLYIQPLLTVQPVVFEGGRIQNYTDIIFTSQHAVRQSAPFLNDRQTLWCVGEKTAEACRAHGFGNVRVGSGTGEGLYEQIIKTIYNSRFVIAKERSDCGDPEILKQVQDDMESSESFTLFGHAELVSASFSGLPRPLQDLAMTRNTANPHAHFLHLSGRDITFDFSQAPGLSCDRLIVYETEPTQQLRATVQRALEQQKITHIALFSQKSAETLRSLTPLLPTIILYVLSDTIAQVFPHNPFHLIRDEKDILSSKESIRSVECR